MISQIVLPEVPTSKDYVIASLLYIHYTDTESVLPKILVEDQKLKLKHNLNSITSITQAEETLKKYEIPVNLCRLHVRCGFFDPIIENHKLSNSEKIVMISKLIKDYNK